MGADATEGQPRWMDGWMGEEPAEGLTPILEGLRGLKERRKSV